MDDFEAIIAKAAAEAAAEAVKPFQAQLDGHTDELKYLRHIDDIRICLQEAVNVRDWVDNQVDPKKELKESEKLAQARLKCLMGKVESPEIFWEDMQEFISYAHRAMHVGYKGPEPPPPHRSAPAVAPKISFDSGFVSPVTSSESNGGKPRGSRPVSPSSSCRS